MAVTDGPASRDCFGHYPKMEHDMRCLILLYHGLPFLWIQVGLAAHGRFTVCSIPVSRRAGGGNSTAGGFEDRDNQDFGPVGVICGTAVPGSGVPRPDRQVGLPCIRDG